MVYLYSIWIDINRIQNPLPGSDSVSILNELPSIGFDYTQHLSLRRPVSGVVQKNRCWLAGFALCCLGEEVISTLLAGLVSDIALDNDGDLDFRSTLRERCVFRGEICVSRDGWSVWLAGVCNVGLKCQNVGVSWVQMQLPNYRTKLVVSGVDSNKSHALSTKTETRIRSAASTWSGSLPASVLI